MSRERHIREALTALFAIQLGVALLGLCWGWGEAFGGSMGVEYSTRLVEEVRSQTSQAVLGSAAADEPTRLDLAEVQQRMHYDKLHTGGWILAASTFLALLSATQFWLMRKLPR